ncbi:TetR/AcrR family transcriptional regulator [Heyndrickxia sporothermodurans]
MVNKKEMRSEETKRMILSAAKELFSNQGFDSVTMRQIAKKAGCSHTTIYIYFKDKEALLHQLSMPRLLELYQQLVQISEKKTLSSIERLKKISSEFIRFSLLNQNMYFVFINAKSTRVDEEDPELEINKLRIKLFEIIKQILQECLNIEDEKQLLRFSRIFFYHLNGIINTYSYLHEPVEVLMERLIETFDESVEILILGFKGKLIKGDENK